MAEQADEMTLTLRKPVSVGEQTYTEFQLREPTADELVQIDKLEGREADILAISLVAGVPKGAVGKIGARDLVTGARFLSGFFVLRPGNWGRVLDHLARRYGKTPAEIARHRWSELNRWIEWAERMMANNRFAIAIVADDLTEKGVKAALKRLGSIPTAAGKANKGEAEKVRDSIGRSRKGIIRSFGEMEQAGARVFGGRSLTGGIAEKLSSISKLGATAGEGLGAAAAEGGILSTALSGIGIAAGTTVGIIGGLAFLGYKVADGWSAAGASLGRLSATLGIATKDMQAFRGVGERFGVDKNSTDGAVASIAQSTHDAFYGRNNNALALMRRLNIGFTKKADGTLDYNDITMQLADAVKRQKDPLTQKAITDVFGATAALPMLRQGSAAIKTEKADYEKHGAVLSDEDVATGTRFAKKRVETKQLFERGEMAAGRKATNLGEPIMDVALRAGRGVADGAPAAFAQTVRGSFAPAAAKFAGAVDSLVEGRAEAAPLPRDIAQRPNFIRKGGIFANANDNAPSVGRWSDKRINEYVAAARRPFDILRRMGVPEIAAAGLAANFSGESRGDFRRQQPGGPAFGLAQWEKDRQRDFKAWSGHDIRQSTEAEQYHFALFELQHGQFRNIWERLKAAKSKAEAARVVTKGYERPKFAERDAADRAVIAERIGEPDGVATPRLLARPKAVAQRGARSPTSAAPSVSDPRPEFDKARAKIDVTVPKEEQAKPAKVTLPKPPVTSPKVTQTHVHRHDIRIERDGGVKVTSRTEGSSGVAIHRAMAN